MKHVKLLNWPKLTQLQVEKIVKQFDANKQYSKKVTSTAGDLSRVNYVANTAGYFNLSDWPNKVEFFNNLFQRDNIKNAGGLTIQCSINELPPHTDFARTVSALCILEGLADTVFYKHKTLDSPIGKIFSKHDLIEVERLRLEPFTWYLFDNQTIHGVENYQGRRLGLSLDLTYSFINYQSAFEKIDSDAILFI